MASKKLSNVKDLGIVFIFQSFNETKDRMLRAFTRILKPRVPSFCTKRIIIFLKPCIQKKDIFNYEKAINRGI